MRAGKMTFTARGKLSQCIPTADAGASPRMTLKGKGSDSRRSRPTTTKGTRMRGKRKGPRAYLLLVLGIVKRDRAA